MRKGRKGRGETLLLLFNEVYIIIIPILRIEKEA